MKHKYRNYYFPVLICIVFCLCIFLVRHVFSVRTQTNASLPVTEVRQSFSFLNTIDFELSELCDGDLNNTAFFQELETERTSILTGSLLYPICRFKTVLSKTAIPYRIWSVPEIFHPSMEIFLRMMRSLMGTSVIWRNWFQNMHRITIRSFSKRT